MTQSCGNCKHWYSYTVEESNEFYDMPAEKLSRRWGSCGAISHGWGGGERAFTLDASDYQSSLRTRDDFGCVLWGEQTVTIVPAK